MISPDPQSSASPQWTAPSVATTADDPLLLLDADLAAPENRYAAPALWQRLLEGEASAALLQTVALQLYPVLGGRSSNALFAKISNLEFEDGKLVFQRLYERTRDVSRNPEALWRRFALAVGVAERSLDAALAEPSIEARGFIEQARWFGHRSSHEAAAVSYAVETSLPAHWGEVGAALRDRYGLASDALRFFEVEAAELGGNREFLARLVRRYCDTGWKLFLGRRAAREVNWAWHTLAEAVEARA